MVAVEHREFVIVCPSVINLFLPESFNEEEEEEEEGRLAASCRKTLDTRHLSLIMAFCDYNRFPNNFSNPLSGFSHPANPSSNFDL